MDKKFTVGIIVSNHFGVLNRVAALYAKRGYNIDSLAVGETEDSRYSRITIVSTGDKYMSSQVVKQLKKLYDVKLVTLFDNDNMVSIEQMLIKLKVENGSSTYISRIINFYSGRVMDFSSGYVTVEVTGSSDKIDAFIAEARSTGIIELCRSGHITMNHGIKDILSLNDIEDQIT